MSKGLGGKQSVSKLNRRLPSPELLFQQRSKSVTHSHIHTVIYTTHIHVATYIPHTHSHIHNPYTHRHIHTQTHSYLI